MSTFYDRVKESTNTSGTGSVTLLGAQIGYQSFACVGNGNTCYYCIADQAGSNWEVGIGTYSTAGPTLARTTVLASSNAGSHVSFGSNFKDVFLTSPAVFANTIPVANGGTGDNSLTAYAVLCGGTTSTGAVQPVASVGTSGQVLTSNGAGALPTFQPPSSGFGTVNTGTTGQVAYYASNGTAVSGESLSSLIDSAIGSTQGDILYRGASTWSVLAPGTSGQVLTTGGSSANPSWSSAGAQSCIAQFVSTQAVTVSNTTSQTTILGSGSGSLSPTAALANGTCLRFKAQGYISTAGSSPGTLTMTFQGNGATLGVTAAISVPASLANEYWEVDISMIQYTSSGAGTMWTQGKFTLTNSAGTPIIATMGNSIVSNRSPFAGPMNLLAQWSVANSSNSITATNVVMDFLS